LEWLYVFCYFYAALLNKPCNQDSSCNEVKFDLIAAIAEASSMFVNISSLHYLEILI
jgi:hypothetical protein